MEWVKKQLPAVLSEYAVLLVDLPTFRREMEERSELEVKEVYKTLMDTGGRPSRPIHDAGNTDDYFHALCHWEVKCSQFGEELREWKKFLGLSAEEKSGRKDGAQLEERQSAASSSQLDLWKDYRAYQHLEVDTLNSGWNPGCGRWKNSRIQKIIAHYKVLVSLLIPVFEKLQQGILPRECRMLEIELAKVHKSDVQVFGVSKGITLL